MANYHIRITFDINIAEWRIDDPLDLDNAEWSLSVFDRNVGKWTPLADCNRPGESHKILKIEVVKDEASG